MKNSKEIAILEKTEIATIPEKKEIILSKKAEKVYTLSKGTFERKEGQKAIHPHLNFIAHAIILLINEGKEKATRKEIMDTAINVINFYSYPSKSSPEYCFSWWHKSLKNAGFID